MSTEGIWEIVSNKPLITSFSHILPIKTKTKENTEKNCEVNMLIKIICPNTFIDMTSFV